MKIGITGGSGFIGKWLIRMLSNNHDFVILGRNEYDSLQVDGRIYKYIPTDYSPELLVEQLKNCEAVIHLAAKRVSKEKEGFEKYLDNVKISANVFEVCRLLNIVNVINLSSISVYSCENTQPWMENDNPNPVNFYGITKLTVEKLAQLYNIKYDMRIKSLRLAQVVGVGEREGFMLMEFIKKAGKKETLTLYGKGEGRREYIYIKDVVEVIAIFLEKNVSGIYNIGMGINVSHKELAETINDVFENKGNLQFLPEQPEDKNEYLMSGEKACKEIGWAPKWSLKDALFDIKNIIGAEYHQ